MKLAEALIERADAQKRLAQIQARATAVARYQEDEQPAEDAAELLAAGRELTERIATLIRDVNHTNAATELDADGARWARQLRSELRYVTPVPVADLRREADDLARQHRELDTRLQAANWTVDVIED